MDKKQRSKREPYACPRCGYQCIRKSHMQQHLFLTKKPCPSCKNDIELTDEIKNHILANRIYHIPKVTEQQIINQTINNYNTMNNFLNGIEPIKKLNEYLRYNNIQTLPFEMSVERRFEKERLKLEKGHGFHRMDNDYLFEVIDEVTSIEGKSMEDLNIIFDQEGNHIRLFEEGEWKKFLATSGTKKIINTIQDYFWHTYECYLIRKISKTDGAFDRQKFRELLEEYYTFLACIEADPYVKDTPNNKIMYTNDDDEYWNDPDPHDVDAWTLSEEYVKIYNQSLNKITLSQQKKVRSDLLDLLKRNSKRNTAELNKAIMSLIKMDADFKHDVLKLTTD